MELFICIQTIASNCVKYQAMRVNSYTCVRDINVASVSTIYRIYFGTLHTMWYFLLSILLTNPL